MFRPPYNETKRGLRNQQPDTKALELERIMFRAAGCVENLQRPLNPNTIQMQKDFVVHINHEMEIRLPAHSHRQQSTHTTRTRTHARTHIHTHTHEKTIKIAFSVSVTSEYTMKTTSPSIQQKRKRKKKRLVVDGSGTVRTDDYRLSILSVENVCST